MFDRQTVFVLGAGASWHYGYPTGEDLVREVRANANLFANYLSIIRPQNELPDFVIGRPRSGSCLSEDAFKATHLVKEFEARLHAADPLVIDYFLGHNRRFEDLGRMLIAWVLLDREQQSLRTRRNINRDRPSTKDNWIRFILSTLTSNCKRPDDLLANKIHFITFNYDRSLERALLSGLNALEFFGGDIVPRFLKDERIFHVYGALSPTVDLTRQDVDFSVFKQLDMGMNPSHPSFPNMSRRALELAWDSSRSIQIIDPHNKESDPDLLARISRIVRDAANIYILGYGFDPNNSHRIGLDVHTHRPASGSNRHIHFTNYSDSNNIMKNAGVLFRGNDQLFLETPYFVHDIRTGDYFEQSKKAVYDALSLDF